jgi:DNA-binding transcriptional LysR family regulator
MHYKALKLEDLELFSGLARMRSVRAVARFHHMHPSRVSKALERIERKMETVLVERSAAGLALTQDGFELLTIATQVLDAARPLERRREIRDAEQTLLAIGGPPFLVHTLLASGLHRATELVTRHRVRLIDVTPDRIVEAGLGRVFDAAVHIAPDPFTDSWATQKVGHLRWGLFASVDHPLPKQADAAQVIRYPFVIPAYLEAGAYVAGSDHCPVPLEERIRGHEVSSADAAPDIVAESDQLAFIPVVVAEHLQKARRIREIRVAEWPPVSRPVYLSVRSDVVKQSTARALVDWLETILD